MISKFFIERPILANVMAIIMIFFGGVSLYLLPITHFPDIVPPTIQVSTSYVGADAKTIIKNVALIIEKEVNGVEGMLYMQSTSTNSGDYNLIVTFDIGTDVNLNQILVQNRVQAALSQLPESVQSKGVAVKQKSTSMLEIITLTSKDDRYDGLFLNNYATINMIDQISRVSGVGSVGIFGSGDYAIRIWLDPNKMQALSLTPKDVLDAIKDQNRNVSTGAIGGSSITSEQAFQFMVNVPGQLSDTKQFEDIIIKSITSAQNASAYKGNQTTGARVVKLRDVARVELGSTNYNISAKFNGKSAAAIAIFQTPGANALKVAKEVNKMVKELAKDFPPGLQYDVPFNTTIFVEDSINEVFKTLIESAILVIFVIMIFLQNFRATLIPATTVPVTIMGAFIAIYAMGFSINLLTLFALILSIGIVVDDAIVIVEGAVRHIEHGLTPKSAALKAMTELTGPIIGITLVLMAVFLPAGFMPGLTGGIYAQFSLVIAATAFISAINAMTLKPTQCAMWLKPIDKTRSKNIFFQCFDKIYDPIERNYVLFIEKLVRHNGKACCFAVVLMVIAIVGLIKLPAGFIPMEDQGYMMMNVMLPDAASPKRTELVLDNIRNEVKKIKGVKNVVSMAGVSLLNNRASLANAGMLHIIFDNWSQRGESEDSSHLHMKLKGISDKNKEAQVMVLMPPSIPGLGQAGGFQMMTELKDGSFDYSKLQVISDRLVQKSNQSTKIKNTSSNFRASVPQLYSPIDRLKAEALGVNVGDAFDSLQTYLGSSKVNTFSKFANTFSVFVQADLKNRSTIEQVRNYHVKNESGDMVPLGTLTSPQLSVGPSIISLYNMYPASSINGGTATGYSSGEGIEVMEKLSNALLPTGMGIEWTGTALQEILAGNLSYYIFILSLILIYLILAAQYENWVTPAAVLLGVPLALLGTVSALTLLGIANNMYTQIGILLLIALSAKNAILIVEVAREERLFNNKSIMDSAIIAAKTRFRPIVMTSFAFILGVLPLVFASGAGAISRQSIGISVSSGMLASTCIAVIFVPAFYVLLQTWQEKRKGKALLGKNTQ